MGRSSVPLGFRHCGRHQQDERGHDQVPEDGWGKSVRHHQERHPHEGPDKRSRAAEARVSQQYTPQQARADGPSARAARRAQARKEKARTTRRVGERSQARGKGSGTQNPNADRECFCSHRKGHIKEECRICMADERDSKNKDEKEKRKDKRFRQKEKKRVNALEGRGAAPVMERSRPRSARKHARSSRSESRTVRQSIPVRLQVMVFRLNGCGLPRSGML